MKPEMHYATVTEALEELKERGFTTEFAVKGDHLISPSGAVGANDFEIVDIYRYEGNSDPGDEAVVYAIQSNAGVKGVLVMGYGPTTENVSSEILNKLGKPNL